MRFDARRADALRAEEARLLALAADFRARIGAATGPEARELLRPWIKDAILDHARRTVVLTVRRIPQADSGALSNGRPGPG